MKDKIMSQQNLQNHLDKSKKNLERFIAMNNETDTTRPVDFNLQEFLKSKMWMKEYVNKDFFDEMVVDMITTKSFSKERYKFLNSFKRMLLKK